ncbi:flavin reductase family protein [uncultured Roseibium sp.]|uniref:flavin reductase family protein n=1 Tax=uncultured Roseibium sp. TaxID=1936171 RepID=UPI00262E7221|nr:flavin reductase family protein [uncultured Roseibium sp.]
MNAMTGTKDFAIDPKALRQTLACFPTGVAIATTRSRTDEPIGVTISSFNSVSMDPPLVLWSLARKAGSLAEYKAHPGFAINILSHEQADLCRLFASTERDRFSGLEWVEGVHGVPCLKDCAATLECETQAVHEGGDHEIFIGRVLAHMNSDKTPLAFGKGQLGAFAVG